MAARSIVATYSHWDSDKAHWDQPDGSIWDAHYLGAPGSEYRPNSSVRSWLQIVRDADKDFDKESLRPIAYEFSNGRKFRHRPYS